MWFYLRGTGLRVFKDKDDIVDACCFAWNDATKDVDRIVSL